MQVISGRFIFGLLLIIGVALPGFFVDPESKPDLPKASPGVSPAGPASAVRLVASVSMLPATRTPATVKAEYSFESGFGSKDADPLEIYRQGIAPGASPEKQYLASEILVYCLPYVGRRPYPQRPEVTAEQTLQVDRARADLKKRCLSLDGIRLDDLNDSLRKLSGAIEGEASQVSRSYVAFSVKTEQERKVARKRLNEVVKKYGPASLHWLGPELSNYISSSSGGVASEIRGISDDSLVHGQAVYMAMCDGSEMCSADGLFYNWLCSELWQCGGSVPKALSADLTAKESEQAEAIAKLISEAIKRGAF